MRGLQPLQPHALACDKPLCASLDRFTLRAATRAGALDPASREGRMKLLALVKDPASIARTLAAAGEATEVPQRSPGRAPPYW
jgi:hypothetical protein